MMRTLSAWVVVLAMGCPSKDGQVEDSGADTDSGAYTDSDVPACTVEVDSAFPVDGESDAYYRTGVRFVLTEADATASIEVQDAVGAPVAGTSSVVGLVTSWEAATPLVPEATYTATLTYACGTATTTFTTSNTGAVAVDVTGRVYNVDLGSGQWLAPFGIGDAISSALEGYGLLLTPTGVGDITLTMLGGVAIDNVQDLCRPTLPLDGASYDNPYFQATTTELVLEVSGALLTITEVELSGAFAPDGARIQGVVMKGNIDTRPLAIVLFGTEDGCDALAPYGITCEECADGSGPYCVDIHVDNLTADEVNSTLVEVIEPPGTCP